MNRMVNPFAIRTSPIWFCPAVHSNAGALDMLPVAFRQMMHDIDQCKQRILQETVENEQKFTSCTHTHQEMQQQMARLQEQVDRLTRQFVHDAKQIDVDMSLIQQNYYAVPTDEQKQNGK